MIRHITLGELNELRKKPYHKTHKHEYENVFLFQPPALLNSRAYKLCKLCGQMVPLLRDDKIDKEIDDIISKKVVTIMEKFKI